MNNTRFLGITLLLIGIIIMYKIDNDLYSFIGGLLIGIGTVISGKIIFSRKEAE